MRPYWRAMAEGDLGEVFALSTVVHPGYPERIETFAGKLRLFAPGCLVLVEGGGVLGYCFSHPWTRGDVPGLDCVPAAVPDGPDIYYIHDLALGARARGAGLGGRAVALVLEAGRRLGLARAELVSVSGSVAFWARQKFAPSEDAGLQESVRRAYSADAVHMSRTAGSGAG